MTILAKSPDLSQMICLNSDEISFELSPSSELMLQSEAWGCVPVRTIASTEARLGKHSLGPKSLQDRPACQCIHIGQASMPQYCGTRVFNHAIGQASMPQISYFLSFQARDLCKNVRNGR